MNLRILAAAMIAAAIALGAYMAGDAHAATSVVKCSGKTYGGIDRNGFPVISQLRAINLPRKTDGYAPRCLVAESVAGRVQARHGRTGVIHVYGARWDAGRWRVTLRLVRTQEGQIAKYTATHSAQRVTFTGSA